MLAMLLSLVKHLRTVALALGLATLFVVFIAPGAAAPDDHDAPAHGDAKQGDAEHGEDHGGHKTFTAMDHVLDSKEIHIFHTIWPRTIHLPNIFGFQITKFMVLELLAAGLVILFYVPMARRLRDGALPRGAFDNAREIVLEFVRDEIAKPSLGEDIADKYVPFLWTLFLFILFNNLLGMIPFLGSATASIYVTGGLALVVFVAIHGSAALAMRSADHGHGHDGHHHDHGHDAHGHAVHAAPPQGLHVGLWRYLQSLWPQIDVPIPGVGLAIKVLVFLIEIVGIVVRNAVLAVRLFANMFAGHMVLATILLFITMAANAHPVLWGTITLSSVLGIVLLSLLELFVAFLQAYIFTFLTALFMGMAITPQH